ncbi:MULTISPECIES: hypothetical protein [Bacillus]|nr:MULTISPECIES: hypothetical protein [Bacillus]MCV4326320.1 hypothetical protein [Bacillus velezensis]MDH3103675.1 hypothetical protein [Bacillus velezensis]NRR84986.1 hypothetical protein [Bacillus velezensis]NRS09548.1 hypothetical protein [Bacillus velezensis]WEC92707.1 hypothetical protein PT966_06170 [Bacillus velezensis]
MKGYIDPNGNEVKLTEKAFKLIYKEQGYKEKKKTVKKQKKTEKSGE